MATLILGLLIFLGVHSARIVVPAWRERFVRTRGEGVWKGVYALAAAIGFALVVVGYNAARGTPLVVYTPPAAMKHFALVLMVPVFPLLLAAYLPGRIAAATKHPMLLATQLWALAHLLANGNAADLLLFGGFLVWAIADRIAVKHRPPAAPAQRTGARNDAIAIAGGLVVYFAFIGGLHRWLIGVSPI